MGLADMGNCRHHWFFNSANYSGGSAGVFTDQVGSSQLQLASGAPVWATDNTNAYESLDLFTNQQYLTAPELEILGDFSVITVFGYRAINQLRNGWGTRVTNASYYWFNAYGTGDMRIRRGGFAQTFFSGYSTSNFDIVTAGMDARAGTLFVRFNDTALIESQATPETNAAVNKVYKDIQYGLRFTQAEDPAGLNPMPRIAEAAFYSGNVTKDPFFLNELLARMSHYSIPTS